MRDTVTRLHNEDMMGTTEIDIDEGPKHKRGKSTFIESEFAISTMSNQPDLVFEMNDDDDEFIEDRKKRVALMDGVLKKNGKAAKPEEESKQPKIELAAKKTKKDEYPLIQDIVDEFESIVGKDE